MIIASYLLSLICLILNISLYIRFKQPYGWFVNMFSHALSPFLVVIGGLGAWLGWLYHAPLAVAAGMLGALISVIYIAIVTVPQPGFELAFGKDWKSRIPPEREAHMLKRRWSLGLPRTGEPLWERDIPFWTIPNDVAAGGGDRKLLCDVWQPPEGVARSGIAFIYLHGSAWYFLDKDFGTRPFFRHLAAQGHVIMDVAYRLCPEVDIYGMIGDVKRAVAWMKNNANRYGVNPDRIVLSGGSAGAHLALLAAYAPNHPQLTPAELQGSDLSVHAVVSYYGPNDLRAAYEHTHQEQMRGRLPKVEIGLPGSSSKEKPMRDIGRLDMLLGGYLDEIPEIYELASPVSHVHPDCPPTLLIQGTLDCFTPVAAAGRLHQRLVECGVPAVNIVYPLTNHAFDLLLPQVSPPAQAALYYAERFLALMA
jgi:acetyl esterase/lipase